jgi:hypothetical protein
VSDPFINVTVKFSYRIRNYAMIRMLDENWSRIMDSIYEFAPDGGNNRRCYDQERMFFSERLNEYISFLDDYSDGIKLKFYNTSTHQIEERVFTGPVFETYDRSEDQIADPTNFPNALIRIKSPTSADNPMTYVMDYDIVNDTIVRFRKKTYNELLPDRTFRTIKTIEMLSV